jgi:hypothetical protein
MLLTVLLINVGLATLAVWARAEFGSIESGLSYLRGNRLIPNTFYKDFGTVLRGNEGLLEFKLKNWTDRPIRVFGARSSCACVSLNEFPMGVLPRQERDLRVQLQTRKTGRVSATVRLFTDDPARHDLVLTVVGFVR